MGGAYAAVSGYLHAARGARWRPHGRFRQCPHKGEESRIEGEIQACLAPQARRDGVPPKASARIDAGPNHWGRVGWDAAPNRETAPAGTPIIICVDPSAVKKAEAGRTLVGCGPWSGRFRLCGCCTGAGERRGGNLHCAFPLGTWPSALAGGLSYGERARSPG